MDMYPAGTRVSFLAENGVVVQGTVLFIRPNEGGQSYASVRVDGEGGEPRVIATAALSRI